MLMVRSKSGEKTHQLRAKVVHAKRWLALGFLVAINRMEENWELPSIHGIFKDTSPQ